MIKPRAAIRSRSESAFTLIELALVIVLLAVMSTLAASRFGIIDNVQRKSAVSKFINTWEFLSQQARARGESYRLIIDITRNVYTVRREVPVDSVRPKNVDHLRNLRLDSEIERRAREEQEKLESLEDEYKEEDVREGDALENIFYRMAFRDPEGNFRLGVPLEFPSMKDEVRLPESVRFRDVSVRGEEVLTGVTAIRFTSTGANEFAVVHLLVGDGVMTALMNPATGKVQLNPGDTKYEWTAAKK